jgi:epoxyqueuosine reductase
METGGTTDLMTNVYERLAEAGIRVAAISARRVPLLLAEIAGRRGRGELDATLSREYLSGFDAHPTSKLPGASSVLIAASPQPTLRLTFGGHSGPARVIVPPTYVNRTDGMIRDRIAAVLEPRGHRVVQAALPLKLLAARSGMTEYGRNNITYTEEMGSYFRLSAHYTDAPLPETGWGEPSQLDRCCACSACIHSCPSGAIRRDRFLLRAERCLTYHNERNAPFPQWINPAWHRCLVGCMECQNVCPVNAPFRDRYEDAAVFSPDETEQMLAGTRADRVTPSVREKLMRLCLWDDYPAIARNLRCLLLNPRSVPGIAD